MNDPWDGQGPSKFTQRRVEAIVTSMANGNFYATAARAAGISAVTAHNWLERGRQHEKACVESGAVKIAVEETMEARDDAGTAIVAFIEREPAKCRDDEHPYLLFLYGVARAEALAEEHAVLMLASNPDWRAHAFLLERRHVASGWAAPDAKSLQVNVAISVTADDVRTELAERIDRIAVAKQSQQTPSPRTN